MRARLLRSVPVILSAMLVGTASACTAVADTPADDRLAITVSVVPQKYFVERIGGDQVAVTVMVEPGASPTTYEPKPAQLKALSGAAAYLSIGVPFEDVWLGRIAEVNRDMVIVDTSAGIERVPIDMHHHEGEDEDHGAGAPDPHVWLSPALVKTQSWVIYEALVQLDPDRADVYRANLEGFLADIDVLVSDIEGEMAGLESRKFMVFHPSWGYFARDFGLEQIPVEVGGQEPSAQELADLVAEAKEEGIRVIFAQPEFSTADVETIAKEIDGEVILVSPLAEDWLANLRSVADAFVAALGESGSAP